MRQLRLRPVPPAPGFRLRGPGCGPRRSTAVSHRPPGAAARPRRAGLRPRILPWLPRAQLVAATVAEVGAVLTTAVAAPRA